MVDRPRPQLWLNQERAALDAGTHIPAVDDFGNEYLVAVQEAHKPGDHHEYRAECKVCGQPGQVVLSIEPQRWTEDAEGYVIAPLVNRGTIDAD